MLVLVMGVSGSGKTTIGMALAVALDLPYVEADIYHPQTNVEKMSAGHPLNDDDRNPWLRALHEVLAKAEKEKGCVLGCSALKEAYRAILREGLEQPLHIVYLHASRELLLDRISHRKGHFFPAALLDSQLATLEEPKEAIWIKINQPVELIVAEAIQKLKMNT